MTQFIHVRRLPMPRSYYAINLFGFVFTTSQLDDRERRHECIHTAQMRELAYVLFYAWYVAEWLWLLLRHRNAFKAYRLIRFEREAYRHEGEPHYLSHRRHYRYGQ